MSTYITGTITIGGVPSEFQIDYEGWEQWGAVPDRLSQSVRAMEVMHEALCAEDIITAGTDEDPVVHRVTVDESTEPGDIKFKAFCEACDWCGERWHHADQYADIASYGAVLQTRADAAYGAALAEGQAHIEDMEN
jgi:hypothetical protein